MYTAIPVCVLDNRRVGGAITHTHLAHTHVVPLDMSARQLNRLAKAKGGLDPLLGGAFNEESDESDGLGDSEEESATFSRGGVSVLASAESSVSPLLLCSLVATLRYFF